MVGSAVWMRLSSVNVQLKAHQHAPGRDVDIGYRLFGHGSAPFQSYVYGLLTVICLKTNRMNRL